jgi:hypothetical protein
MMQKAQPRKAAGFPGFFFCPLIEGPVCTLFSASFILAAQ